MHEFHESAIYVKCLILFAEIHLKFSGSFICETSRSYLFWDYDKCVTFFKSIKIEAKTTDLFGFVYFWKSSREVNQSSPRSYSPTKYCFGSFIHHFTQIWAVNWVNFITF